MITINSVSTTRFSFNGIEYFRNYISVVRGDRVEIFNCYEREDIMLPLTHYSEITLNGITYSNAADLQSALQSVIYSRATLGADEVEVIEQNNIGKVIQLNYVTGTNLLNQVLTNINSITSVISATDNPVFFTAYKSASTSVVAQKLRFQFMGGKGTWGTGGKTVLPSHLYQLAPEALLPDDITANSKSNVISLGQISSANDFLNQANSTPRNFSDTSKLHFLSYTQDSVLYLKRFTGQPDEYDGTTTVLTEDDFEDATNSNVQPGLFTPSLKDITNIDPSTDVPITIVDSNSGNKTILTGNQIKHTSLDGNITTIDYESNTDDVSFTIPAKNTDDVFAMQSDINGMTITANQSASELYLKNAEGTVLATINVGFLNNEGTTFFYNETTEKLELKDDLGNVLSTVPVSAFVSNLMQSVNFNGSNPYILEFKDAENNIVDSVSFGVSNIQGLQALLDGKFNNPTGTTAQYIKGNGSLSLLSSDVLSTQLTSLSTVSSLPINSGNDIITGLGRLQGQANISYKHRATLGAGVNIDCNTEQDGIIGGSAWTNGPVTIALGLLRTTVYSPDWIYQEFVLFSEISTGLPITYLRMRYNGTTWGTWTEMPRGDKTLFVRSVIPSGADLNNYLETGIYSQITNTNAASGTNYPEPLAGSLHVAKLSSTLATQTYHIVGGSLNVVYTRIYANGWGIWKRLWNNLDFTTTDVANWNAVYAASLNYVDKTTNQIVGGIKSWNGLQEYNTLTSRIFVNLQTGTGLRTFYDVLSYSSASASVNGKIKISLPLISEIATMWVAEFTVIEYSTLAIANNLSPAKFIITGYGDYLTNCSVWCSHPDRFSTVKFGRNTADDRTILIIEKYDNTFVRPKITLDKIVYSYLDTNSVVLQNPSNYDINITTDVSNFVFGSEILNVNFVRDGFYWNKQDFTSTNIANWNNAVSRNHAASSASFGLGGDLDTIAKNTYTANVSTGAANKPFTNVGGLISLGDGTTGTQILGGRVGNELWFRPYSTTYGLWYRVWNSGDFTSADIANWNAYATNKADLVGGKIPASQLPSYVDDVLEYETLTSFPTSGETGKLYVSIDTNLVYRWSGSAYVVTNSSLALGETSATAYRGDRGKTAYDHSQTTGNPHNTQIADISGLNTLLNNKISKNGDDGDISIGSNSDALNLLAGGTTRLTLDGTAIKLLNAVDIRSSDGNTIYSVPGGTGSAAVNTRNITGTSARWIWDATGSGTGDIHNFRAAGVNKAGVKIDGRMYGSAAMEDNDFVTKQQTVKNIIQTGSTSVVTTSDLPAYFIRYTYNGTSPAILEIPASGTMDGQEILFMNTCNFNLEVNIAGGTNSIYLLTGMTNKISCNSGSSIKLIWNGSVWYFKD